MRDEERIRMVFNGPPSIYIQSPYLKRDVENARKKFLKNSNTTNETNYKTLKSTYKNAIKNAYNHHYINNQDNKFKLRQIQGQKIGLVVMSGSVKIVQ